MNSDLIYLLVIIFLLIVALLVGVVLPNKKETNKRVSSLRECLENSGEVVFKKNGRLNLTKYGRRFYIKPFYGYGWNLAGFQIGVGVSFQKRTKFMLSYPELENGITLKSNTLIKSVPANISYENLSIFINQLNSEACKLESKNA